MGVPTESALDRVLALLRERGPVQQKGREWRALCPAHADTHPSLDVAAGDDGRVLLVCRSHGCQARDICRALGLSLADLFDGQAQRFGFEDRIVRTYDYRSADGTLLYQAVRLSAPKDFRQRRPDGNGGWVWNLEGVARVLYRLPELLAADPAEPVFVVEGEKDVESLAAIGLVATTNPQGAMKWRPEYSEPLRGRTVVILPDNDDAGRRHAELVRGALDGKAASVKIVTLPGLPDKGDVTDWLRQPGNDCKRLLEIVAATRLPGEPEPWDPPIPLTDPAPDLAEFPIEALPAQLQDLVAQIAEAVCCPVDYPAVHALGVAAGAVGASYDLAVKPGYYQGSNLWICVVAPPGSGKSPGVHPILAPVFAEHARRREIGSERPVYVSDVTVEQLAQMLSDNPRGLLMVWDEMSGWLSGFNQYKAGGRGSDRSHYLSIWDGRPIKVDRKSKDSPPIFVQRPRLSVVGGIQPEVLDALRTGPSDGLFDRFLFAYPHDHGLPVETFATVNESLTGAWSRALQTLWAMSMHEADGRTSRPNIIAMAEDARPMWQGWTRELSEMAAQPDAAPYFRSVGAKISGYAARLALVVHLLREAYGERPGLGVGVEDLQRGIALAAYFLNHADRVHRSAGRDERLASARAVLRWTISSRCERFTRSDAWRALRRNSLFRTPEDLGPALRLLTIHRCVRWAEDGPRPGPGRPASGCYEVNPQASEALVDTLQHSNA